MGRFEDESILKLVLPLWVAFTLVCLQAFPVAVAGPADLFQIESIKNMTLSDLEYEETERYTIGDKILVVVGDWSNGEWETFDREGNPRTIKLHQRAALYLPVGVPCTTRVGLVEAAQKARSVESSDFAKTARLLEIPLLSHGEYRVDWDTLGYRNRNQLLAGSLRNLVRLNPFYPKDFITGNFFWVLPYTDMCAVTLLQRLAAQEGWSVEGVGLDGGSKEGYACWVASAVDDRIKVASPGGYQFEDFVYGFSCYERDWNWEDPGLLGPIMGQLHQFYDWLRSTPAGEAGEEYFSVEKFKGDLYPRFFYVDGDVTLHGMHDARYYPLGSESPFLLGFTEKNWRYSRRPGQREPDWLRQRRLLYLTGYALCISDEQIDRLFPKVVGVEAYTTENREFRILAQATAPIDSLRLWWSHSQTRRWNEQGQAPWVSVPMEGEPNGFYISEWQQAPRREEIAYYVEAETWHYAKRHLFPCRDASPVQFLWRTPAYTIAPDTAGLTGCSDPRETPVAHCPVLYQNDPNPFNARTTIAYQLPAGCYVKVQVYDLLGRRLATLVDCKQQAGYRSVAWDAWRLPSGVYFYRLTAADFAQTKRMMLVK